MQKSSISYILRLSFPIFFANLAIPLVGIIDTALMGNLGNLSYLTATSVAANLFSMIFWSFGFLRMGTVGMVSQALGQNSYQEILNIILRNLLLVLIVSALIFLSQILILNLSLEIFDLSELTKEFYIQYFKIRIYSAPGELTLYILTGLFVGLQKTKISSLIIGFFSILNIFLSIILVTKFDLNIKGVAYGTFFSALITSIIFLIYTFNYLKKFFNIKIDVVSLFDLKKMKDIFNINFDIFIRTILLTFSFLWFTYLGTQIGENYVAVNAILINLVFLSAFILDAYAFSIIYFFINENVIYLMSDIENIRKLSSSYVIWLILLPFIASFCYQFDGIFIGSSQTKELRNAMIFSVFCYLLISIILTKYLSNTGIWISLCFFMILRGLSLFYYLDKIYQRFKA